MLHVNTKSDTFAILAHSLIGHGLFLPCPSDPKLYSLAGQVDAAVATFDLVRKEYPDPEVRICLMGHSIGSWIALQVSHGNPCLEVRARLTRVFYDRS